MKKILVVGIALGMMAQTVQAGQWAEVTFNDIKNTFKKAKSFRVVEFQRQLMSDLVNTQQKKNPGKMNWLLSNITIFAQGASKKLFDKQFGALSVVDQMIYNGWLGQQHPLMCTTFTPAKKLPGNQGWQRAQSTVDYTCKFKGFEYLKNLSKADRKKAENYVADYSELSSLFNKQSVKTREKIALKCVATSAQDLKLGIMFKIGCLKRELSTKP